MAPVDMSAAFLFSGTLAYHVKQRRVGEGYNHIMTRIDQHGFIEPPEAFEKIELIWFIDAFDADDADGPARACRGFAGCGG